MEDFHRRALAHLVVQFAQLPHRMRFVLVQVRHAAFRRALDFRHVGDQYRMVRGHRAAAFGDDPRRRQFLARAGFRQRLHDARRIVVDAVVDRVVAARTRAFVIDAEAAAHIHVGDLRAEFAQLDEVAGRLAHAVGDVAHIGNLRTHVEVQQLQAVAHAGVAQALPQVQQLARVEPELGLVAAAVLPLAGAEAGQAHAHAQARLHAEGLRLLQHQLQLGGLLDDDEGLQAQLAADQRQADVFAVLVAVADDQPAGPAQRQHRHQLRLAAGFQAKALAMVRCQGAGHALVLVDLDRIDRGVAARVVPVLLRLRERGLQFAQAVAQHVRETHQHRQLGALRHGRIDHVRQRHGGTGGALGTHRDASAAIDLVIAFRPVRDRIGLAGKIERPIGHLRGTGGTREDAHCRACGRRGPQALQPAVTAATPAPLQSAPHHACTEPPR